MNDTQAYALIIISAAIGGILFPRPILNVTTKLYCKLRDTMMYRRNKKERRKVLKMSPAKAAMLRNARRHLPLQEEECYIAATGGIKTYTFQITGCRNPLYWYQDKIGTEWKAPVHQTDSIFWYPGTVLQTTHGFVHWQDVKILKEEILATMPSQFN